MQTRLTQVPTAVAVTLILVLAAFYGCSSNSPTQSDNTQREMLAGSGRLNDDDPFYGGPENSGPSDSIPQPPISWNILFYHEHDCTGEPGTWLIDNQAAWADWWEAATGCLYDPIDSNRIYPQDTLGPYGGFETPGSEASVVDFDLHSVAIVTLAPDSGSWCARRLNLTSYNADEASTTIEYQISLLEGDCCEMIMGPTPLGGPNAPSMAVLVPRPAYTPATWVRDEVTINCDYPKPDPNQPHTIYYTDAACDLGPTETLITDSLAFVDWLTAAMDCDRARADRWRGGDTLFYDPDDSSPHYGNDTLPDTILYPPMPPSPYYGLNIDFKTHAVIILRAGEQYQWGGGVWLQGIFDREGTTVYSYTVMVPADDCPPADLEVGPFNPTVAIRVPRPASSSVAWNRTEEMIRCDWDDGRPDTIWVDTLNGF
jgi:hypothetical protein